jgi:hypothetical protein
MRHDLALLRRVRHKWPLHWVLWARERVWHALREIWLVRPDGRQYSWQHSRICLCRGASTIHIMAGRLVHSLNSVVGLLSYSGWNRWRP